MKELNRVEIHLSKPKLAKLLIFSVLFLCGGLWLIIKDPEISNPVFNNLVFKILASYGATLMGVLGTYFFSKKLFDNKPGIIISSEGITDNTSAFKFGLIPWSDIAGIHTQSIQASIASKQHFITIELNNPEVYIARESNVIKRKLLAANANSYGSPVHIATNGLKTDHRELATLLNEYFEKYGTVASAL